MKFQPLKLNYLQQKFEQWQALQLILSIDSPDSRWELLQIWLRDKGDWQKVINKVLSTPDLDDCLSVILEALNVPRSMLMLFDADGKIQAGAQHYISVIKTIYFDRLAPPKQLI
jgi:hypothetical protein